MRPKAVSSALTRHSIISLSAAIALLISSVALADLISGNVSTASSDHVTYTQLTLDEPSSVAQGDLMLANIAVHGGSPVNIRPTRMDAEFCALTTTPISA